MTTFGYNEKYMLKNEKPWFPIMGEMHYSRYPKMYWRESIEKMKAGGVDVVSSYVLWIHHEEIEGVYDFSGNKDLRTFVKTIGACGAYMILRVGPWCHAEVRNGGFPDWLLQKSFAARTNDPAYLEEVRKFYTKIYEQVAGLLHKEGGPIIGLQIENEYGHCGGLDGEAGEQHMRILTQMAKEIGFDVPIYTATGWGGAVTGGLLPVMGGYCEAPWDQRLTDIEPSGNYIFTHERNDHNIGSDYGFCNGITFDIEKFPYLTAELGGGLQVTHHRRPVATSQDIGAMSMVKLGSGVNLLGYYMYHGGTNPTGKLSTLQESRETGSINDLPVLNYDFRGPIREFGQISETFKEIKLLTMFVRDFGEEICELPAHIPDTNPLFPTNQQDLRISYRHNGKRGYVFVNNYQRRVEMAAHKEVTLAVDLGDEVIEYPKRDVANGAYFFYPFNMPLGAATLKTAMATPLCRLNNTGKKSYVFYGQAQYAVDGVLDGYELLTLTREEAKNAWKVKIEDTEHLFISNYAVLETASGVELVGRGKAQFKVYPDLATPPKGFNVMGSYDGWGYYECAKEVATPTVTYSLVASDDHKKVYDIQISQVPTDVNDVFVQLKYNGDRAKCYVGDTLVTDHFYTGRSWEVGLKRFGFPMKVRVVIYPLQKGDAIFLETWPTMVGDVALELTDVAVYGEHRYTI